MEYLNHVTLNTGHARKTYSHEVDKRIYFILKNILKDAMGSQGAKIFDNYTVKITKVGEGAVSTLFGSSGAPILTTACSKDDDGSLWRMLHSTFNGQLATKEDKPTSTPYIADRLEVGSVLHMDALKWTGDFSRCFAWAILFPDRIR
ncbi:hypothetical protein D3C74_260750 [compost metagenome]